MVHRIASVLVSYRLNLRSLAFLLWSCVLLPNFLSAELTVSATFNPSQVGDICGIAADPVTHFPWIQPCFGTDIYQYSPEGVLISSIARPGESANDIDIDFSFDPMTFGNGMAQVPAAQLLVINGESDEAEVYAVDPTTGSAHATLGTDFGVSHVVGGAFHPIRDTMFLVQDRVPSGTALDSLVAEVDRHTGLTLASFKIDTIVPGFTVNFGDLEANSVTGRLFVVSSDESTIAEFEPNGLFVREHLLPVGVNSLSGIGLIDETGQAWVSSSDGQIWRLDGLAPRAFRCDFDDNTVCDVMDLNQMLAEGPLNSGVPVIEGMNDQYNMNTDLLLNSSDVEIWLTEAAYSNGFRTRYFHGDANLDGFVDGTDFGLWNANKFTNTLNWNRGDFNGDGLADGSDFGIWNANKFQASDGITIIPEPTATALILGWGALGWLLKGRS